MTYRNPHTVDAEVPQAENAGPVCHHADLGVGVRPVTQNRPHALPLLNRDVQGLGPGVEHRVLQAHVANGGRVDQGHQLLGIVDEQAVEEVDVLALERRQVQILVDVGLAGADHLEGALALRPRVFHDVRDQARQVLGDALLGGESET